MTSHDRTLGIVGGGQMAEALIRGLIESQLFSKNQVYVYDVSSDRLAFLGDAYGVQACHGMDELCEQSDTLLCAVKPQVIREVSSLSSCYITSKHLFISIMAGVSITLLEELFPNALRIIRVMPNTPALILEGASALSMNDNVSEDDRTLALNIFSAIGLCLEVPEYQLDAVTGLSGSGPAYIFTIIDALIDGGVFAGLPRPIAEKLALQTLYGSVKLAMESGKSAAELKAQVTSPGGTTIHGLYALEQHGLRAALMDGVMKAANRSREL